MPNSSDLGTGRNYREVESEARGWLCQLENKSRDKRKTNGK